MAAKTAKARVRKVTVKRRRRGRLVRAGRRNPPRRVEQFDEGRGLLVSRRVIAVDYYNVGSARRIPYRHEFESTGVEMWALDNGALLIRHPRARLHDDFLVRDSE